MSWFNTGQTVADFVPDPKGAKKAITYPFTMARGESTKIVILNPDDNPPPVLHFHTIQAGEFYERVLCTLPDGRDYCHFCEHTKTLPEKSQWKTAVKKAMCFTILDLTEREDGKGGVYPPSRRLRLTADPQMKNLQTIYHMIENDLDNIDALQYAVLKIHRKDEDKSAAIGEVLTPLKMLDKSQYDEDILQPFTEEEILTQFVIPGTERYEEIIEMYPLVQTTKVRVNRE